VIGGDAGTPLRRALVNLGGETLREGRGTTTDENGRFEFGDLPAGRFQLMASKAG
jgi:Carboxypeptidase regulatory-like domain